MSQYRFETATPVELETLAPLFQAEFDEVGEKEALDLDIDYDAYRNLMRLRRCILCVIRTDEGVVGYAAWVISSHPKYRKTVWAFNHGLWIKPEHRRPRIASRLLAYSEDVLKDLGCQFAQGGGRSSHPAALKLYEIMGYKLYEVAAYKKL